MKTYRMIIRTPAANPPKHLWGDPMNDAHYDFLEEEVSLPDVMTVAAMQKIAKEWFDPITEETRFRDHRPSAWRGPKYGASTSFAGYIGGEVATIFFSAVI